MRSFSVLATAWVYASVTLIAATAVEPKGELTLVGDGYSFTEGPTADAAGDVYFTDQPNDRIVHYEFATGELSDWLSPCGRSNGLFFVAPNKLIACADANNELWQIDVTDKSHEVLVQDDQGRRLCGPNDCWVDADGTIYFTDPLYKRPYWTNEIPTDSPRCVFRVTADGELSRVAEGLKQPNGIIGDAENRILYVADIGDKKTYRYRIAEDGSLVDRQLFCQMGSDGMTIDQERNVYLTGKGVSIFDRDGQRVGAVRVPKGWTANVTFAGPENRHLFITAQDAVYTVEMSVAGLRVP
ncbi:MAG: SMP-30/gluconolactonase/LRE family protein [Rubripirellula sp.]